MKHTDELIANQAKQLYNLEKICVQHMKNVSTVKKMLYCIGGPLNDNKHQYNKDQLQIFFRIIDTLEFVKGDTDD